MENSIINKLQAMPDEEKKTDIWRTSMAIALDNGSAYYDDMYEAVDYYLRLGFTPEVICNQIEFGCLNVDSYEIRRLYNIYKRR